MKQKYARLLAVLCALALAFCLMPAAFAAETTAPVLAVGGTGTDNTLSFDTAAYGYAPVAAKTFTVTATGAGEDAKAAVTVSNSSLFAVSAGEKVDLKSVPLPATITVTPAKNLSAGEYSGNIAISMKDAKSVSVTVKFKVEKHAGLKEEECFTGFLKETGTAGSAYKIKSTDGVQLATGYVKASDTIGAQFSGDSFSFVYGCSKNGATGVTSWKTSAEQVKATEAGVYTVYYKPVGNKNFADGDAIAAISGLNVEDDRYTITLAPNGELFELNAKTELKTGYDHKLPADTKLPTFNRASNRKIVGWYTTSDPEDKNAKKVDGNYVFDKDTTIYAAWGASYRTDDLTVLCYADTDKTEAAQIALARVDANGVFLRWEQEPKKPVHAGSTFWGWATSDGETLTPEKTKLKMNEELYALWGDEKGPDTVIIPIRPPFSTPPSGSGSTGSMDPVTVLGSAYVKELRSQNWDILSVATVNAAPVYTYKRPNGTMASGSLWIEGADGVGHRYIFNNYGVLQTGKNAASNMTVTADGDILLNGNLYYLNPNRNLNDPRTCYVMTNYVRKRPNYGDQTYYDQDGITFEGWMKNANGGLRYQTCLRQPGQATDRYLIVWRAQTLPACQHPDHPGDPAYTLPAGRYFFDDDGVLVTREGWNDGKDGKEYYTNAYGQITSERTK